VRRQPGSEPIKSLSAFVSMCTIRDSAPPAAAPGPFTTAAQAARRLGRGPLSHRDDIGSRCPAGSRRRPERAKPVTDQ
jgi:hypothetical protein